MRWARCAGSGVVIGEDALVAHHRLPSPRPRTVRHHGNRVVAAHAWSAAGQVAGFGLVRALSPLDLPALELARSTGDQLGDSGVFAGVSRPLDPLPPSVAKQEFAGSPGIPAGWLLFTRARPPLLGRRRRDLARAAS